MKKLTIILSFIFTPFFIFSQKTNNIWYFGRKAGLDFNTSPPTVLTNNQINTDEGCASIADDEGNLLFYTNGEVVYNRNHEVMENGEELYGSSTSSQSVMVVPRPEVDSIYYLFTVNAIGGVPQVDQHGFNYSIVDLTLNNGLGAITEKNILLRDSCSEHLIVVPHSNDADYWIIIHGLENNSFYAYLLTEGGVSLPVESVVGHNVYAFSAAGQSQASPDGQRIAFAYRDAAYDDYVSVFDFDPGTGVLSNEIYLPTFTNRSYGVEFSPDSRLLYRTYGINEIHQHLLYEDSISESVILTQGTDDSFWGLQIGPDNKIYISNLLSSQIAVIENPNIEGLGCNLILEGQDLLTGECYLGLPNSIHDLHEDILNNTSDIKKEIQIYPNPTYDKIYFKGLEDRILEKVKIFSLRGNCLAEYFDINAAAGISLPNYRGVMMVVLDFGNDYFISRVLKE